MKCIPVCGVVLCRFCFDVPWPYCFDCRFNNKHTCLAQIYLNFICPSVLYFFSTSAQIMKKRAIQAEHTNGVSKRRKNDQKHGGDTMKDEKHEQKHAETHANGEQNKFMDCSDDEFTVCTSHTHARTQKKPMRTH